MFPGSRKKTKISDQVRFDKLSHWIRKGEQRRCAECGKQHYIFVESNDPLHPEHFKEFHEQ